MLSALVLSGGRGSRMGRDKGLVPLGGAPLVRYLVDLVRLVADEVIVSIAKGRTGEYSKALKGELRFVEDLAGDLGPLEGIVRGLEAARGDYVLVCPCDTPFLRRRICDLVVEGASGKDGAVPKTGPTYYEPLHGAYRKRMCLPAFRRILESGEGNPTMAYSDLDIAFVEESDLRTLDPDLVSFRNINTPEDLAEAEAQLARLR